MPVSRLIMWFNLQQCSVRPSSHPHRAFRLQCLHTKVVLSSDFGYDSLTSGGSTMAHLKLFVLGQPRLERDGRPLELNLRKALALLVYLALSGQLHSRDALATLLWPESDGREARARLRRTLHRLSQAIGD